MSKLEVMLGRQSADAVRLPYRDIDKEGVEFRREAVVGIDPATRHTLAGAERLRDKLADFGGGRVLVSVLGQPFKCPPAPFEGSFLIQEHFTQRGIRGDVQMMTTFPMQRPVPVTGEVSQMFREGPASRGIEELSQHLVTGIDPAAGSATGSPRA